MCGVACFYGVSHAPLVCHKGSGPIIPIIFGTSYMRVNSMRKKNNQIVHGDRTTREGKCLRGRSRMLTRDLFAVKGKGAYT